MPSPEIIALNMPPEAAELGKKLAGWCDDAQPSFAADFAEQGLPIPQRCSTCAFRLGTVPNRSLSTMVALKCVMEQDTFHCHEKGKKDTTCIGWMILVAKDAREGVGPIQSPWEIPEGMPAE